ncbi:hypothetical protein SKAU_G00048140 [Synaphobranchus kaupii]|uniref:Uncharacterized protein n=1 Tax=Synaphobranchus kaupii TaxID=118154 RepID=A0A9Q1J7B6_SYNKA|nr:hypothetical protein SKAU_G00048140 [Synaphobranchus kaupii]
MIHRKLSRTKASRRNRKALAQFAFLQRSRVTAERGTAADPAAIPPKNLRRHYGPMHVLRPLSQNQHVPQLSSKASAKNRAGGGTIPRLPRGYHRNCGLTRVLSKRAQRPVAFSHGWAQTRQDPFGHAVSGQLPDFSPRHHGNPALKREQH